MDDIYIFDPDYRKEIFLFGHKCLLTGQFIKTVCGTVYEIEWDDGTNNLVSEEDVKKWVTSS